MSKFLRIVEGPDMNLTPAMKSWWLIYDDSDPGKSFSLWRGNRAQVFWDGTLDESGAIGPVQGGGWMTRMHSVRIPAEYAHAMVEAARLLEGKDGAWIRYAARQWEKLTGQKPENP